MKRIDLKNIVDALEDVFDDWDQFLNTKTGEVVSIPNYDREEEDEELAEEIDASDHYIRLPDQYDIYEKRIMEQFAENREDQREQNSLFRALRGRRPYRHFKDACYDLGIEQEYYSYKEEALYDIAERWCEAHDIPYFAGKKS